MTERIETITQSELKANLPRIMEEVFETEEPLLITRKNGQPCVMLSFDLYNRIVEACGEELSLSRAVKPRAKGVHAEAGEE